MERNRTDRSRFRSGNATSPIASSSPSGSMAGPPRLPCCRKRSSAWWPPVGPSSCWWWAPRGSASRPWCTSWIGPSSVGGGLFVTGKFEQYRGEVPYFTFIAGRSRGRCSTSSPKARDSIAAWRQRLLAAVGQEGQLVIGLIPEVGLVIGPAAAGPGAIAGRGREPIAEGPAPVPGRVRDRGPPVDAVPR